MNRFVDIAGSHRLLDALFALHQEAVLDRDWDGASRRLAVFRGHLAAHMALEDALFPILARGEPVRGGTPAVYVGEHDRLTSMCDRLGRLVASGGGRREAIAALDQGFRLKGLHEHHVEREEAKLFPWLDAAALPGESALLAAFAEEHARLRASLSAVG